MKCMPCHTKANGPDGNLAMKDAMTAYTSLVGTATPPTGGKAGTDTGCKLLDTSKKRVVPSDPTTATSTSRPRTPTRSSRPRTAAPAMPETASNLTLSADQKTKIHDWIMGGAKP